MTLEEIKLRRLQQHHLLNPANTKTIVQDLCGVQAQFLSHALHGLAIRCHRVDTDGLVKSWTNRGTMHLFAAEDLPLFLHEGRKHHLRPVDTMESDMYLSSSRKAYFADLIVAAIGSGTDQREHLKTLCESHGMTESEAESIFNPWGGLLRALCETGRICHKVQEQKAFMLCPAFEPMAQAAAQSELVRRYFTHFGPATVKDAAYFFGWPQSIVKTHLSQLPVESFRLDGKTYFFMDEPLPEESLPRCLFLAGFDQLLLGYEKTENPFLTAAHLRRIFNLAGIVHPAILVDGTVAGRWKKKDGKLNITLFSDTDQVVLSDTARILWTDLKKITFE